MSYLILPAVTLGTALAAILARLTRNAMLDVLAEDYIRSAKSKGLKSQRILSKHALRNAIMPVGLDEPLPMNRFRPNLVVCVVTSYAEDSWRDVRLGDIKFRVVKPCARCTITTVEQTTGHFGKEPLRTLAAYRRVAGKVMFGQNLIHDAEGVLNLGDKLVCI